MEVYGSEKPRLMSRNLPSQANASLLSRKSVVAQ